MERRLGRGLDSLLGGSQPVREADESGGAPRPAADTPPPVAGPLELPLASLRPNAAQPREVFAPDRLEELSASIRRHGVMQPVTVRRSGDGYEIISGERRWRAARMAGLESIPVVVREGVDDGAMLELALVENLQREDLDPIERAQGFRDMVDRFGLTQEEVAERVGFKRSTVANHLRLLDLPEKARDALAAGVIQMGHARALLPLGNERRVLALVARIVREGLSVRQVEALVREATQPGEAGGIAPKRRQEAWALELERRMTERLGSRTRIENRTGYRGRVVIDYHDREELDRLIERLSPREEL